MGTTDVRGHGWWTRLVYYGWWIVLAGTAVNAIGAGIYNIGASVFFLPVSRDLSLSYPATSFVFSAGRTQSGLEGLVGVWLLLTLSSAIAFAVMRKPIRSGLLVPAV
jgi:hypothetical protein